MEFPESSRFIKILHGSTTNHHNTRRFYKSWRIGRSGTVAKNGECVNRPLRFRVKLHKSCVHSFQSYFHILLQNSDFCDTQIDISLHMINWVGSQGCTCVGRKVDFCGCSPKNLRQDDFARIQVSVSENSMHYILQL